MDYGRLVMDSVAVAIIGVIGVLLLNLLNEYRGWRKVEKLIGRLDDTTLNKQHNEIKENINDKTEGIKTKVDRIDTMLIRNEERYLNLNSDQKEIRNNINKFLHDWEGMRLKIGQLQEEINTLNKENRLLKSRTSNVSIKGPRL